MSGTSADGVDAALVEWPDEASARPFRLLALGKVSELIEGGPAQGAPISLEASLRDAYAECLWSGRDMLPVTNEAGDVVGRIRRDDIALRAEHPQ